MMGVAVSRREPPGRTGHRRGLSFAQYMTVRLGARGGSTAWFNFFIKPFGAASFAEFWRLWNPVYGYFLYFYSYRPLSRLLPRWAALMTTFIACGLVLHDLPAWAVTRRVLPPGATIAFILFGLGVVLSEVLHMDLSRWPFLGRAMVNAGYLASCVVAMLAIVRNLA
jgi:D-alanyl-lipoteichoic acid acyltransferase DltB (MBOAT superfamily)